MMELIDSPANVLAVRAAGRLEKSDYTTVLEPAVARLLDATGELRAVIVVGSDFEGATVGAGLEDTKFGFEHLSKWKRCAVVTDKDWLHHGVAFFGWMIPGDVKLFAESDVAGAIEWAAA
jgi:hypothetical protein